MGKKEIEAVFKNGRFLSSAYLSFKYITGQDATKVAFIVPKTTARKATARNLLKRRGRAIMQKNFPALPEGIKGVFVFNKKSEKATFTLIEEEIKKILSTLHV